MKLSINPTPSEAASGESPSEAGESQAKVTPTLTNNGVGALILEGVQEVSNTVRESQAAPSPRLIPGGGPRPQIRPIPLYQRAGLGPVLEQVMAHSGTHQAEVSRRMRIRPQSLNQYVKQRRARPSLDWLLHFLSVNEAAMVIVFPTNQSFLEIEKATVGAENAAGSNNGQIQ